MLLEQDPHLRAHALSHVQSCWGRSDATRWSRTLLLADRLWHALPALARDHTEVDAGSLRRRVIQEVERLREAGDHPPQEVGIETAGRLFEPWAKAVCALRGAPLAVRADLGDALVALELFPPHKQTPPEGYSGAHAIWDEAYHYRNWHTHTRPPEWPCPGALGIAWAALLLLVDHFAESLQTALRGLVVRRPQLARTLWSFLEDERAHHQQEFVGREDARHQLDLAVEEVRLRGGYVIVHAGEGFGKSALLVSWTEERSTAQERLVSEDVEPPSWLPATLWSTCKATPSLDEVAQSLLDQANALLVEPVELRDSDPLQVGDEDRLRAALTEALRRLVAERGEATVVVDALDELTAGQSPQRVLPELVPPGACVVLSTRSERLSDLPAGHMLRLDGLSAGEVDTLLGLGDVEFAEKVRAKTSGVPLHVLGVPAAERRSLDRYGSREILEQQARGWEDSGVLEACLSLLSVMEPVGALDLNELASYLRLAHAAQLNLRQLRRQLTPVSSHLIGLAERSRRIKLTTPALAKFVLDAELGLEETRSVLARVGAWLLDEDGQRPELIAGFVTHWSEIPDQDGLSYRALRRQAEEVVVQLLDRGDAHQLYQVQRAGTRGERGHLHRLLEECLRRSAELGYSLAQRTLGLRLLTRADDKREGTTWLRRAWEGGDARAGGLWGLCVLLFEEDADPLEEAKTVLLSDAVRQDPLVQRGYGQFLLRNGDTRHALPVLRLAAERGDARSMAELAAALPEPEAAQWRERALAKGDTLAGLLQLERGYDAHLVEDLEERVNADELRARLVALANSTSLTEDEAAEALGRLTRRACAELRGKAAVEFADAAYPAGVFCQRPHVRQALTAVAGRLLEVGWREAPLAAATNLAYLIRRGEFESDLSLDALLERGLTEGDANARLNQALRLYNPPRGIDVDRETAEALVRQISREDALGLAEHWFGRIAKDGDEEGVFVTRWLVQSLSEGEAP